MLSARFFAAFIGTASALLVWFLSVWGDALFADRGASREPARAVIGRQVARGEMLSLLTPDGPDRERLSAADRAAVGRARESLAAGEGRVGALRSLVRAAEGDAVRAIASADLAVALAAGGQHADAADVWGQVVRLAPNEAMKREFVHERAAALTKAGRRDEAAALLRTLPSSRPAGRAADAVETVRTNFLKAKGLVEAGDVEAGTLDFLSRAPQLGDGPDADEVRSAYLAHGTLLAGLALRKDPAAGARFQLELLKKVPDAGPDEVYNAAANLDAAGRPEAAALYDLVLETAVDTESGVLTAMKRANAAAESGDAEAVTRYARLVVNNPAASPGQRELMVSRLLGAGVPVRELEAPLRPLKPTPDPTFNPPADPAESP